MGCIVENASTSRNPVRYGWGKKCRDRNNDDIFINDKEEDLIVEANSDEDML